MRKRRVWRYYCDFCKKALCHHGYMVKHEKRCTMNQDRECKVCKKEKLKGFSLKDLKIIARNNENELKQLSEKLDYPFKVQENSKDIINEMYDFADYCPMCVFSALRQDGLLKSIYDDSGVLIKEGYKFSLKEELDEFWKTMREKEEYEDQMYYAY